MDIGAFCAKETVMFCPHDQKTFPSEQLQHLVPKGGSFGFDVIIEVGLSLFVRCRNNQEIMAELAVKNVFISEREISCLGRKFIIYLALAHRQSQPGLRELMDRNGGFILHVDGTCEGNSPNLFCGLDEISELVLDTIKIPSENKEQLVPFFQNLKEQYGIPVALVHDMGKGIINAAEEVFPGVPDFICHFHFLRDIGKDLLLKDYTALLKRLRKLNVRPSLRRRAKYLEQKISSNCHEFDAIVEDLEIGKWQASNFEHAPLILTYVLIQWVFDYQHQSNGYGFPFDRPHLYFYRRLQNAHRLLGQIVATPLNNNSAKNNKPFFQAYEFFAKVVEDTRLNDLAKKIEAKAKVFDMLRSAMRIALPEGKEGIKDNGDFADMKSIEAKVTAFREWLVSCDERRKSTYASMVVQLDKYWEKLFADPLQNCNHRWNHVYSTTKDEQYSGAFFPWCKTTGPEEKRHVFLEQNAKSGLGRYTLGSEPEEG